MVGVERFAKTIIVRFLDLLSPENLDCKKKKKVIQYKFSERSTGNNKSREVLKLTVLNRTEETKARAMTITKKRIVVVLAVGPFFNRGCHVVVPEKCLARPEP